MKSHHLNLSHKWFKIPLQTRGIYNARDAYETARLVPRLRDTLARNGQLDFYERWHTETVPVTLAMMRRGVGRLDPEAVSNYRDELSDELTPLESKLLDAAAPYFNALEEAALDELHTWVAASPRRANLGERHATSQARKLSRRRETFLGNGGPGEGDLARWLFGTLGFKPAPPARGRPANSVSQSALTYILGHLRAKDRPNLWVLEDLFHRSRLNTILSRYLTVECDPDGRVRPTIRMYGTETLRWSYTGDAGEAIHQWPPEARHVIVPDEGLTYVGADYSQLEARIEAVYYNDIPSLEAFARGEDIHRANALDFFGLTETQWEALTDEARTNTRNYSKALRYKMGFGGKAESESQKLYCPCPRCVTKVPRILDLAKEQKRAAEARWYARHPAVLAGRRRLLQSVKGPGSDHSWTSPFGYRRFFLEPASEAERSIYNIVTQHCAAEIVRRAMVRLHAIGAPLAIQMHDEVVLESPDDEVAWWSTKLREIMEAPVPELNGTTFPVKISTGKTWGALKD